MRTKLVSGKPRRGKCFPMKSQTVTCRVCKRSVDKSKTICEDVQYHTVASLSRLGLGEPKVFGRIANAVRRCRENCTP